MDTPLEGDSGNKVTGNAGAIQIDAIKFFSIGQKELRFDFLLLSLFIFVYAENKDKCSYHSPYLFCPMCHFSRQYCTKE